MATGTATTVLLSCVVVVVVVGSVPFVLLWLVVRRSLSFVLASVASSEGVP